MTNLLMLTNFFPYGNDTGEVYLQKEIEVLAKEFDSIVILAVDACNSQRLCILRLPENVKAIPLQTKVTKARSRFVPGMLKRLFLNDEQEVEEERVNNNIFRNLFLAYFMSKVDSRMKSFYAIKQGTLFDSGINVIYSYRFFDTAYTAIKIRDIFFKNAICITRAHRYDLYEEENGFHYLPLRNYLLNQLDRVYPCSEEGARYLIRKYPTNALKVKCSYLGSDDYGDGVNKNSSRYEIISCSNVITVKRVDLIADIIRAVNHHCPVHWTHIGDGKHLSKIKNENADLIDTGVISFLGRKSHDEVIKIYKNNRYDLFINMSSSEGIPQAIMEANSFGIPAIATNVGGTSEIVKDNISGYLVDINDNVDVVANTIQKYLLSEDNKKRELRESTRNYWKRNFNLEVNATRFVCDIGDIERR